MPSASLPDRQQRCFPAVDVGCWPDFEFESGLRSTRQCMICDSCSAIYSAGVMVDRR